MNGKLSYLLITGGVLALASTAVLPRAGSSATASGRAPQVVTVTARDFAFDVPDTVRAGVTTVRIDNKGAEMHHVQLVRLDEGKTLADVFATLQQGGPPPAWAVMIGGPNAAVPGAETEATLELTPGRYALLCFIPSPDGKPHVMKGMSKELVVVPAYGATSAMPEAGLTMTLVDYGFSLSKPLTAGRHTIRVVNDAAQPHEVVLVALAPGKTPADMVAWIEKPAGPPPGRPLGGVVGLAKGMSNLITVELTPGEYGLICFFPDAGDGKPHFVHGMTQQITVK
ncbi:MAG TPA: hypothetical protein VFS05_04460 [Gemmatimonadaceae bacterium]|nr:hypothetical protein [Gemmatimonadaceae bacterium]